MSDDDALVDSLKAHYGSAARKAAGGRAVIEDACCTGECCGPAAQDGTGTLGAGLYDAADVAHVTVALSGCSDGSHCHGAVQAASPAS